MKDFSDFRRAKRLKLAEQQRYPIWGPSPTPSPEPDPQALTTVVTVPDEAAPPPKPEPVELDAVAEAQAALFVCAPAGREGMQALISVAVRTSLRPHLGWRCGP